MIMKKRILAVLLAVSLLSGCTTEIEYGDKVTTTTPEQTEGTPDDEKDKDQETVIIPTIESDDKYKPNSFVLDIKEHSEQVQVEFNCDAKTYTDGLSGYNGTGFICLAKGEYTTLTVNVPSSQHYKIGVRICANGTKVAVKTGGTLGEGETSVADGISRGAVYTSESSAFGYYYLDGIYLNKGENYITLESLSGAAYIDDITITNTSTVPELAYDIANSCVSPNASDKTKVIKKYLADLYGNKVLTGQYCTTGTNTEINAIYMETGRYSAMRWSDFAIYTQYYSGSDRNDPNEFDTAVKWSKDGGLVGYTWYWYAPTEGESHYQKSLTDFKLSDAVTDSDIALLNPTSLETYAQTGRINNDCLRLLNDIDLIANQLKLLETQNVTVLFRPLPEAGNNWYWWGESAEDYLWLYKLIFKRFNEYHNLSNVIWVWNGESAKYYPGDDYVDIVGMDMYADSDISGNNRFMDAIKYTIRTKATALTECGRIPNPDLLERDNAYWLWFSLWKGDYIINSKGEAVYDNVSKDELDYAYNNELYITLDELPDFSRY